ncbi:MAG: hypothetical protein U0325_28335 [Polyangiales bacterium]
MGDARIHWGDSASWRCDEGALGFDAGLGASPPEVYVPPEAEFARRAPPWARARLDEITRDFRALGARVVPRANARLDGGA